MSMTAMMRRAGWVGMGMVLGGVLSPLAMRAAGGGLPQQNKSSQQTVPVTPSLGDLNSDKDKEPSASERLETMRQKVFVDERRKKIVADTDRLLQLATELKNDVTVSTKNELSLNVIKKAADIEKLAHDVKERMRQ